MIIDWAHFTPWPALAGGLLIGAAAGMLVLLNGKIAGISGILGGLLRPRANDIAWRLAFLAGLAAAPLGLGLFAGFPAAHVDAGTATLIAGGLLVGIGTRYAAGCTSGHGVCGLSRGSLRSLAAVAAFMAAGFCTVFLARHVV